jgi:hypothetical protein
MPRKSRNVRRSSRARAVPAKPPYTVFVSHSSKDIWIAERMVDLIEKSGAECRIDKRDFEGGGNIWDEINGAVGESNEIVVLFTPNSKDAHWISFEIGAASQQHVHVTPILYSVKYNELDIISGRIALELNTDFNIRYLDELKRRIVEWKQAER